MEEGTDTWLWERCTLRLFRLKLPKDAKSDFSKQFNNMIDLYDQLTEFCWPTEWAANVSFHSLKLYQYSLFPVRNLTYLIVIRLPKVGESPFSGISIDIVVAILFPRNSRAT